MILPILALLAAPAAQAQQASASTLHILTEVENAQLLKSLILESPRLKLVVDEKSDADEKEALKGRGFDLAVYVLAGLAVSNVLPDEGKTVHVGGAEGLCSGGAVMECSLKIFTGLYYKDKDAFRDKVGERVITLDLKARGAANGDLVLADSTVKVLSQYQ